MSEQEKPAGDLLEEQAKRHFDQSVERLDGATLSRLNRGRQAALEIAKQRKHTPARWMSGLGLVATSVLIAVLVVREPASDVVFETPSTDFEILISEESIDMLEDLEFYAWLATAELQSDDDVG